MAKKAAAVLVLEPSYGFQGAAKTARKGVGEYLVKVTGKAETCYRFHVVCAEAATALVRSICLRHVHSESGMLIQGISTKEQAETGKAAVSVDIFSSVRNDKYMNDLVERLNIEESVSSASWERV